MPVETVAQATFYQYQLLKRTVLPKTLNYSLLTLPFIWLAATIFLFDWISIFYFLLAIPLAFWIQYVISRSVLVLIRHSYHKRWSFSLSLPWMGYMPDQYVGYSVFRKVHVHTTWLSLCIIAILFPWSPASFCFSLFFWHIWLMIPRYYAMLSIKGQPKNGMLKISKQDISYYKQ